MGKEQEPKTRYISADEHVHPNVLAAKVIGDAIVTAASMISSTASYIWFSHSISKKPWSREVIKEEYEKLENNYTVTMRNWDRYAVSGITYKTYKEDPDGQDNPHD